MAVHGVTVLPPWPGGPTMVTTCGGSDPPVSSSTTSCVDASSPAKTLPLGGGGSAATAGTYAPSPPTPALPDLPPPLLTCTQCLPDSCGCTLGTAQLVAQCSASTEQNAMQQCSWQHMTRPTQGDMQKASTSGRGEEHAYTGAWQVQGESVWKSWKRSSGR